MIRCNDVLTATEKQAALLKSVCTGNPGVRVTTAMALSSSSNSSRAPRSLPVLTSYERKHAALGCCCSNASAADADRVLIRAGILSSRRSASHRRPSSVISAGLKARFTATRSETVSFPQLQRPFGTISTACSRSVLFYSLMDAERVERVSEDTFRCYLSGLKVFTFEIVPVLLVKVEEEPDGCCIRLLSCKLEGSPVVVAQNDKFFASMVNKMSCSSDLSDSSRQQLTADAAIEVVIDVPFTFRAIIPVQVVESTGTKVLQQLLDTVLPRFLVQLVKDYQAWASGYNSRQPLGRGEI
ncbi:hypothetical protein ACLOJK_032749 [Asimina triloba]